MSKDSPQGGPQDHPFFRDRKPGQFIGRGHPAGDLLEAWKWKVAREEPGHLVLDCHLPEQVINPRGQLFGGFTPTYVDLVALFTFRTSEPIEEGQPRPWLATTNMRIDYFEPIVGPTFRIDSQLIKRRGRTAFVETRFLDPDGELAVYSLTTMRVIASGQPLGDA